MLRGLHVLELERLISRSGINDDHLALVRRPRYSPSVASSALGPIKLADRPTHKHTSGPSIRRSYTRTACNVPEQADTALS